MHSSLFLGTSFLLFTSFAQAQVQITYPVDKSVLEETSVFSGNCLGAETVKLTNGKNTLNVACVRNSWSTSRLQKRTFIEDGHGNILVKAQQGSHIHQNTYFSRTLAPQVGFVVPELSNSNWKVTLPIFLTDYWGPNPPASKGEFASGYPNWSSIGSADVTNPAAVNATASSEGVGAGNCNSINTYNIASRSSANSIPVNRSSSYNVAPYNNIVGYYDEFFYARPNGEIVFRAPSLGWSTTQCSGSNHTRVEMREIYNGRNPASTNEPWVRCANNWESSVGGDLSGTLKVESISKSASSVKASGEVAYNNQATFAQIHGGGNAACGTGSLPAFVLLLLRESGNGLYQVEINLFTDVKARKNIRFIMAENVRLSDEITFGLTYRGEEIKTSISINGSQERLGRITQTEMTGLKTVKGVYPDATNPSVILKRGFAQSWYGQPMQAQFGAYHSASVPNFSHDLVSRSDETRVVFKKFSIEHP